MPSTLTIAMMRIAYLLLFDPCAVNAAAARTFRGALRALPGKPASRRLESDSFGLNRV
jgi:hypothetical protein